MNCIFSEPITEFLSIIQGQIFILRLTADRTHRWGEYALQVPEKHSAQENIQTLIIQNMIAILVPKWRL